MITVNLLPIGAFKEKYKGRLFVVAYGLFMLMAAAGLFSYKTFMLDNHLFNLRNEQQSQENSLNALKRQVAEAGGLTNETFRKWRQLSVIVELEERRRDQTRLLVEIDQLLPNTNAWLLSLKHNQGDLTLEGLSTDKDTVSTFHTRLENAAYIDRESVALIEITQDMAIRNYKLTKFLIRAKTSFPQPTIIEEGLPAAGLPSRGDFFKAVEAAAPDLVRNIQSNAGRSGRGI
ncbi:MAG: PilN domain-containing protein [Candidatus Adiutrix sp.]|jgi:Tfp pilus assembly protein PilN|nr:PilN domain-containing protein [Candidatus Adiutrix sp.]